jgi:hypothetical protein
MQRDGTPSPFFQVSAALVPVRDGSRWQLVSMARGYGGSRVNAFVNVTMQYSTAEGHEGPQVGDWERSPAHTYLDRVRPLSFLRLGSRGPSLKSRQPD